MLFCALFCFNQTPPGYLGRNWAFRFRRSGPRDFRLQDSPGRSCRALGFQGPDVRKVGVDIDGAGVAESPKKLRPWPGVRRFSKWPYLTHSKASELLLFKWAWPGFASKWLGNGKSAPRVLMDLKSRSPRGQIQKCVLVGGKAEVVSSGSNWGCGLLRLLWPPHEQPRT